MEWLNTKVPGATYRLLSEAEWEYIARPSSHANGLPLRNAFGLYDLYDAKNAAWEWVQDCYHASYLDAPETAVAWATACPDNRRVLRSVDVNRDTGAVALSARGSGEPNEQAQHGFRVARTLLP